MKWLRWILIGVASAMVLGAGLLLWVLNTQSGTRASLAWASNMLGGRLQIERIDGSFAGPLTLVNLRFNDPQAGIRVSARQVLVDLELTQLFGNTIHVRRAQVGGIRLNMEPREKPEPEASQRFTLQPPINLRIEQLGIADALLTSSGKRVFVIDKAALVASWTDAEVAIKRLDVHSPDGEIHFQANVREADVYLGSGSGRFRWRAGEHLYRGSLRLDAEDENARVDVQLSSPLRARLAAVLTQTEQLPWRFKLQVPRFDPREALLPDSGIQSLGAALQGSGSMKQGAVDGTISLNDEALHLDKLRFIQGEQQIDLSSTLHIGDSPGRLRANAQLRLDRTPAISDVKLDWHDLVIPQQWVGQTLHTQGRLTFQGNAEQFAAQGELALGPPEQLATIELQLDGTPQTIQLQQLDVVQPQGRFAAKGKLDLQPNLRWNLDAEAQRFNPGAFASQWSGSLNFTLSSIGQISDAGPQTTLVLNKLTGELRGRRLSGAADLEITPDLVVAGTLTLNSGASRVSLQGKPGDAIDAVLNLSIASLNDWLPAAQGGVTGQFTVTGKWPEFAIVGSADAQSLRFAEARADALSFQIEMVNPQEPSGKARLAMTGLTAAGLQFSSLQAQIEGNAVSHHFGLNAVGDLLDTSIQLQGSLNSKAWYGTLAHLMLDVERVAHLTLREPVPIAYSPDGLRLSQLCLQERPIQLCGAAEVRADGAFDARYSLAGVPLGLASIFAPTLPLAITGTLDGRGDMRRDDRGALFGRAELRSAGGELARRAEKEGETAATLLRFADLSVTADLAGPQANIHLGTHLDDTGRVAADVSVNGLDETDSPLRGNLVAELPSLTAVSIFMPQLANLAGRLDAQITLGGTAQEPDVSGQIKASQLAAEVPALGLHVQDGSIQVIPRENGEFELTGGMRSGKGELGFSGLATKDGEVQLDIDGHEFLAADIPAAYVLVSPELHFARSELGMQLTGKVAIAEAAINVQKLPRRDRVPTASADVTVIDATAQEQAAERLPLAVEVAVSLGDEVELTGYGLQSRVGGQLIVTETPGEPTRASGEIEILGRYKAYGQDLTIREGRILYAGTPIDNPRLSIEAVREIEAITAGLRITGNAQSPVLSVFSEPPMGEANALSYLIAGKPLDQIGTGGEGDMLQTAAQSLGTAAGGLLAKNIGRRLGVDELSIKDSEMLGGSAFTVGEYLSPRLFISYGVGLFEPGEVITLRFKLTDEFALQTQRGSEETRAGVQYRFER